MNIRFTLLVSALALCGHVSAQTEPAPETGNAAEVEISVPQQKDGAESTVLANDVANFCFFSGTPPSEFPYTVVRKLKLGKGTYGGVKEILPRFAANAQSAGADAIINYTGSQRFGFWPWRMVRPVVRGTAIRWTNVKSKDCNAMGGTTLKAILAEDKPPAQ